MSALLRFLCAGLHPASSLDWMAAGAIWVLSLSLDTAVKCLSRSPFVYFSGNIELLYWIPHDTLSLISLFTIKLHIRQILCTERPNSKACAPSRILQFIVDLRFFLFVCWSLLKYPSGSFCLKKNKFLKIPNSRVVKSRISW
jgi:hypothetical protein